MTSAILSRLYISLQPVCNFDINMELILKHIIRIGCGFISDYMNRYAFQAWPLYE